MTAGPAGLLSATLGRLTGQDVRAPQLRVWGYSPPQGLSSGGGGQKARFRRRGGSAGPAPAARSPGCQALGGGAGRGGEPGTGGRSAAASLGALGAPEAPWGLELAAHRLSDTSANTMRSREGSNHPAGGLGEELGAPRRAGKRAGTVRPRGLFKTVSVLTPTGE